jgi:hypothetical protein
MHESFISLVIKGFHDAWRASSPLSVTWLREGAVQACGIRGGTLSGAFLVDVRLRATKLFVTI